MPLLQNPRWEKFAQACASGLSASEAYRKIGGKGKNVDVHSARLMVNDSIRARVRELQTASAASTVLSMRERREINAEIARNPQNRAADRIAAIMADAKLSGDMIEKVEHSGQIDSLLSMNEATRQALFERRKAIRATFHSRS